MNTLKPRILVSCVGMFSGAIMYTGGTMAHAGSSGESCENTGIWFLVISCLIIAAEALPAVGEFFKSMTEPHPAHKQNDGKAPTSGES